MAPLNRFREASIEAAREAGRRWQERAPQRADQRKRLSLGGPTQADIQEAVANFASRRARMARKASAQDRAFDLTAERIIGGADFADIPGSQAERRAGRPVARIVVLGGRGVEPLGQATGFLIASGLLMTNHHVFATASDVRGHGAQFGYEHEHAGGPLRSGEIFELDADTFFASDPHLDYAVVAVKPSSLAQTALGSWGYLPLIEMTGKILVGHPIGIIQHPDGGPKRYASVNNLVVDRLESYLHYTTDTRPGSSGSPAFNAVWEVVALHRSGVPEMRGDTIVNDEGGPWHPDQGDDAIRWIANEGARVSRIVASLRALTFDTPAQAALRDLIFECGELEETADLVPLQTAGLPVAPAVVTSTAAGTTAPVITIRGDAQLYFGNVSAAAPASSVAPGAGTPSAAPERRLRRDLDYGRRRGYDAYFLRGHRVDPPRIAAHRLAEMRNDRHGQPVVFDYHHFSLAMNAEWLLQMWSAVNVDYSPEVRWNISRDEFGSDEWILDPRLPPSLQIEDEELYKPARKFDRGHVVRRDDNAWGVTREEVEYANADTFHWTNCTPQHEEFNRAAFGFRGVWGKLEKHIGAQAGAVGDRLTLFAGPVLAEDRAIPHDFGGGRFNVPLDYWKVVVVAEPIAGEEDATRLRSYGFVMEQQTAIDRAGLEAMPVEERFRIGEFATIQRPIARIGERTGVVFADAVLEADGFVAPADDEAEPIRTLEAIRL